MRTGEIRNGGTSMARAPWWSSCFLLSGDGRGTREAQICDMGGKMLLFANQETLGQLWGPHRQRGVPGIWTLISWALAWLLLPSHQLV